MIFGVYNWHLRFAECVIERINVIIKVKMKKILCLLVSCWLLQGCADSQPCVQDDQYANKAEYDVAYEKWLGEHLAEECGITMTDVNYQPESGTEDFFCHAKVMTDVRQMTARTCAILNP